LEAAELDPMAVELNLVVELDLCGVPGMARLGARLSFSSPSWRAASGPAASKAEAPMTGAVAGVAALQPRARPAWWRAQRGGRR